MKYLNDDEIIEIVGDYLAGNVYNYAVMIDGEWGSGKTYFVNKKLIPEIQKLRKDSRKAIYCSLYGLKSSKEITSSIYLSIIENIAGNGKKFIPFISIGTKALLEFIGDKTGNETVREVDLSTFSPLISYKELYFIFDDLERCSMPINDVLGYINHFIEQNNAKVIIIANEKEIGSIEAKDIDGIDLFVSTLDSIVWPKDEASVAVNLTKTANSTDVKKISLGELSQRRKALRDETQIYKMIKEKLIGKTLHYKPNLHNAVTEIMKNCQVLQFLNVDDKNSIVELICEEMKVDNHHNLRTIQFALELLKRIESNFDPKIKESDLLFGIITTLLIAILRVTISYKKGEEQYNWMDDTEYGPIRLKKELILRNIFRSFKFIHGYVYYGVYDQNEISRVLAIYFKDLSAEKDKPHDPLYKLRSYWLLDDTEILKNLDILLENLKDGKYGGDQFREILSLVFIIKGTSIPVNVEDFFDQMKSRAAAGESTQSIQIPYLERTNQYFAEYVKYIDELVEIEKFNKEKNFRDEINQILSSNEDWHDHLRQFYSDDKQVFTNQKGFFKYIERDFFSKKLKIMTQEQVIYLRNLVDEIYKISNISEFFSDDIEHIRNLINLLNTDKNQHSIMKKYCLQLLKTSLEQVLKRLNPELKEAGV